MNDQLLDVLNEFLGTLEEVEILLTSAEINIGEEIKYVTYNKSALLLLSGKFENFVELIAEQYVFLVNNLNLRSSLLPEIMRLHHTYSIITKLEKYQSTNQINDAKKVLSQIGTLWVTDHNFNKLEIECKFSYGKHGEKELTKLFSPIGISDVFVEVEVFIPNENLDDEKTKKVDFKGIFNSVMNMRNNILHQDASPSLTHDSIRKYKLIFANFAEAITTLLDKNLQALIEIANVN